jgi:hypothetical protein
MQLRYRARIVFLILLISGCLNSYAQLYNYQKNYFVWPVGYKKEIVANLGELRNNHWHMGMDCRTGGRENLPIYAAADGYISKISVQAGGFGRCIYVNHPNGLTTVYAHLNAFYSELQDYLQQKQKELKQWAVELEIPTSKFLVNKGEFIALSGNTGGSQGPHLHFEVRETATNKAINPQYFNFGLQDDVKPTITALAFYSNYLSTYEQMPNFVPLKYAKGTNILKDTVELPFNEIKFAITAYDRISGSDNKDGIYKAQVYKDDELQKEFVLDYFGYDETRYMNAHIDYTYKVTNGGWLQHLSILPGAKTSVYNKELGNGVFNVDDFKYKQFATSWDTLALTDTAEIKLTKINYKIIPKTFDSVKIAHFTIMVYDIKGNKTSLSFWAKPSKQTNEFVPVQAGFEYLPNQVNIFQNEDITIMTDENALYDGFGYTPRSYGNLGLSKNYSWGSKNVPLHNFAKVYLKPLQTLPNYLDSKVVMRNINDVKPTTKTDLGYLASWRNFGQVHLDVDTIAPTINFYIKDSAEMVQMGYSFTVADNLSGVKTCNVYFNNEWLVSKLISNRVTYDEQEKLPLGWGTFTIEAIDAVGNTNTKVFLVNMVAKKTPPPKPKRKKVAKKDNAKTAKSTKQPTKTTKAKKAPTKKK